MVVTTQHGWAISPSKSTTSFDKESNVAPNTSQQHPDVHMKMQQAQTGYYWTSYQANANNTAPTPIQYNHTFYPDITANACMNG